MGNIQARSSDINLKNEGAVWSSIRKNFQAILDGRKADCSEKLLYLDVYIMCSRFKASHFVYSEVRKMVKQHIDKMVPKLEKMATSEKRKNQVTLKANQLWTNFADQMHFLLGCLMYLERNLQQLIGGGELTIDFGWRTFRTEILENQLIKQAMANRLVFNLENRIKANSSANNNKIPAYKESPLFNVDTIIEIMTFLTNPKLGLQLSTTARQIAKLSDYVLNKRKRIMRPIVIMWGTREPFAIHLQKGKIPDLLSMQQEARTPEEKKMDHIFDDWFASMAPESQICLPDIEPPECLVGIELIYIMDEMNNKIFRFLNTLHNQLQNCQIVLNLAGFFAKHQKSHLLQFFALFNGRCFSLVQPDLPWRFRDRQNYKFAAKWPLWAVLNNIFFPNCRELTLPKLFGVEANEVAKWLMHPSTERHPRLLKLHASVNWLGDGFETMLQQIKEDFFNPTGKRMFFVEFQNGSGNQHGEWQNGNGEQLRIDSNGITRLPADQWDMNFKDFYELPLIQPKLVFNPAIQPNYK